MAIIALPVGLCYIGEKLISNNVLTKTLFTLKIITIFAFNNELKFRK